MNLGVRLIKRPGAFGASNGLWRGSGKSRYRHCFPCISFAFRPKTSDFGFELVRPLFLSFCSQYVQHHRGEVEIHGTPVKAPRQPLEMQITRPSERTSTLVSHNFKIPSFVTFEKTFSQQDRKTQRAVCERDEPAGHHLVMHFEECIPQLNFLQTFENRLVRFEVRLQTVSLQSVQYLLQNVGTTL